MASPVPVLYVNPVAAVSGAEESLLAFLSRLDRTAYAPVLACPPGSLAGRAQELGVSVATLPLTRFRRTHNPLTVSAYALSWVMGTNRLRRTIQEVGPKIVHSNNATAQLYVASAAEKTGVACVWHARDLRDLPFVARSLCRNADRIIAVSEAVAESLAASGLNRPKVTRIYNGIDPQAWAARVTGKNVRDELRLSSRERIILMAAQLVPWKRHEDAIRAMAVITKAEPHARLVIVGEDLFGEYPKLRAELEKLCAELGVAKEVIFLGHRSDVPDLMAAADLVIIPSDAEPFGRVAVEAMALGKPVVGTRAGGLPEVVHDGETGLLVVPRFPESLAEACLRILGNSALAHSLGEAGRQRVQTHFHIDRTVQETQALYQALLHPPLKWRT